MDSATMTGPSVETVETLLRDELAHGDAVLSNAMPILRHLVVKEDEALFSDEVVSRVRGMFADIARQMLHAQAEAALVADRDAFLAEREDALVETLFNNSDVPAHIHALALEAQLTLRLQAHGNIDPALSPLLQDLVAAKDDAMAGSAMAALAAQVRFVQHCRRMSLPVGELPGDLFHEAMLLFRSHAGESDDAAAAERKLRQAYHESHGRLALIARVILRMGQHAPRALDIGHAGVAIFVTALSMASGQERDLTVLSFSDRQFARLVLALRAAELDQSAIQEQFVHLHPDVTLPDGFEALSADRAAQLLSVSAANGG